MTSTTITRAPSPIVQAAHKLRRRFPGMAAADRIRFARHRIEFAAKWGDLRFDSNLTARIERDGFTIHVQYELDDSPDTSYLGEFTDRWERGARRNPNSLHDDRVYAWWVPCNRASEAREWFREHGYARHEAWVRAEAQEIADMRRLLNGPELYLLKVSVFRAGVELETDYLGGVDLGTDYATMREEAPVMASEEIEVALGQAKRTLKHLAGEFVKAADID